MHKQHPNIPQSSKAASFPILVAIFPWSFTPWSGQQCSWTCIFLLSPPWPDLCASLCLFPSLSLSLSALVTRPLCHFLASSGSSLSPQGLCSWSFLCLEAFPSLCSSNSSFWSLLKCHYLKRSLPPNAAMTSPFTVTHTHHFFWFFFILNTISSYMFMWLKK